MEKAYRNLGYVFILLIPLSFLAFFKTYFNQFPLFEENTPVYLHLHVLLASIWILLLIVQPVLIRNRKYELHKKIGKISYLIFPLLIASFIPLILVIINSENPGVVFFPLADSILLILFYSLAIFYRRNPSNHMRYMIGTALVFLGPTIGRIGPIIFGFHGNVTQNIYYGLIYIILLGLILIDKKHGRNSRPYYLIFTAWIIHQILSDWIMD